MVLIWAKQQNCLNNFYPIASSNMLKIFICEHAKQTDMLFSNN